MRTAGRIGTLAAAALLVTSSAWAGIAPTPVRATAAIELQPAGGIGFLAWAQVQGSKQVVFAKPAGEAKFKVNPKGTHAASGGISDDTLVYQQFRPAKNISDLKLYDMISRTRSNPPAGVNTGRWEYWPDLDGPSLLFGRLFTATGKRQVILFDLNAQTSEVLTQSEGWNRSLDPGQVAGVYVVWGKIRFSKGDLVDCEIYLHNTATDTTQKIPNPNDKCQYSPSVLDDGTVFYGRSGYGCGLNARLLAYPPGGPSTELVDFPKRKDFGDSYAYTDGTGDHHVLYDPGSCTKPKQDIYEVLYTA